LGNVKDELPDTMQGMVNYIRYCEKSIKEGHLHIKRMEQRLVWCEEKMEKFDDS